MPTGNGEPTSLWLFQDVDQGKSVRMTSTDPTTYLRSATGIDRALVLIDSIWDGTTVETVSRQLVHLTASLRGPQGEEVYIQLNFRSRT